MDWSSRLEAAKAAVKNAQDVGTGIAADAIEQHWPAIQRVLREQVAPAATAAITNDEFIDMAVRRLHPLLPLPIRLVIRPRRLSDWCLRNRDRVLAAMRHPDNPEPTVPG